MSKIMELASDWAQEVKDFGYCVPCVKYDKFQAEATRMEQENERLRSLWLESEAQNSEFRGKLAALEAQEPFAGSVCSKSDNATHFFFAFGANAIQEYVNAGFTVNKLYLAAGAKKDCVPMTNAEITQLASDDGMCVSFEDIARAVEAHHKIGVKT